MKYLAMALLAVIVCACAQVNPKPFNGPSGRQAYSMECSNAGRTLDDCYKKAGEVCPNGYTIIDKTTAHVGVPINGSMMMAPQHSIAIECK